MKVIDPALQSRPATTCAPEEALDNLMPGWTRRWPVVGAAWVLPLLVLCAVNAQALWLCWGEMDAAERTTGYVVGVATLLNLVAGVVHTTLLMRRRQVLGSITALVPLMIQASFLIFVTFSIEDMIPRTVQAWMLPPDRLLLHQWAFVMIPAFYATAVVSGYRRSISTRGEVLTCIGALVLPPAAMWLLLMSGISESLSWQIEPVVFATLIAGATMTMGVGLLRVMHHLSSDWFDGDILVQRVTTAILALVFPLGGLAVNAAIPFPVDFQHPLVYVATVLNAVALLLPTRSSRKWNLTVWALTWAALPFTLYFFFVFLPYLPLSIPAMLVVGAGVLVLVPTLLFLVHLLRLRSLYGHLDHSPAICVASAALAFAVLPACFLGQNYWMRDQLRQGMDYVLTPDVAQAQEFDGHPALVRQSLRWHDDFKSGVYYPILTNIRSRILFGGMVLPDAKAERVYNAFAGEPLAAGRPRDTGWNFFVSARGTVRGAQRARTAPALPAASLHDVSTSMVVLADGTPVTRLRLEMQGAPGRDQSEYKTEIRLPAGTWVAGFALYIGEERVEGRLFEEKTALWVYRMIRDDRRSVRLQDPATLTYEADGTLRLQVFPFDPGQVRVCELDLLGVAGAGVAQVGERTVPLLDSTGAATPGQVLQFGNGAKGLAAWIPSTAGGPAFLREPYLHVFVDRSAAGLDADAAAERIARLRDAFPEAGRVRVTAVNWRALDLTPGTLPWDDALKTVRDRLSQLPKEGGCLAGPALARAAYAVVNSNDADTWRERPIFVVLAGDGIAATPDFHSTLDNDADLIAPFLTLLPDVNPPLVLRGTDWTLDTQPARHVKLFRAGGGFALSPADGAAWLRFPGTTSDAPLQAYEPSSNGWMAIPAAQSADVGRLHQAALFDMDLLQASLNPARWSMELPNIVQRSKELHLLTAATAFVVVENSAQWKMLEMKENQKLSAAGVLEFDETPEPAQWLVAGLFALLLIIRQLRIRSPIVGTR